MSVGSVSIEYSTSLYIIPTVAELYFLVFAGGYFCANISDVYHGTNTKEKAVMERELGKSAFDSKKTALRKQNGCRNIFRFCVFGKP